MSKLHGRDLLEEMQWKYAGGPLPAHRRRKAAKTAAAGCAVRFAVGIAFCLVVILLAKWLLF